jgi:hypothetical protein
MQSDSLLRNSQVTQLGLFRDLFTDTLDCQSLQLNHQIISGQVTATDFRCTGLVGARNTTRYVGGTVSGPPTLGTFLRGDYIVAQDGQIWVCDTSGSPGSWDVVTPPDNVYLPLSGGVMTGTINMNHHSVIDVEFTSISGLTGASEASRYVGGTVSNPPTSGDFLVGDYIVTSDGFIFVCTTAGNPGVWMDAGSEVYMTLTGGTMQGTINMGGSHPLTVTQSFGVSGLTGSDAVTRFVGGTTGSYPSSGMFQTGDYIIAQDSNLFICISGGNPGTWSPIGNFLPLTGGQMSGSIDMNSSGALENAIDLSVSGITGAKQVSRYMGATNSGHPLTGTFQIGDYVIARNGNLFICTSGGSPGTWTTPGSGVFLPLAGGTMSGSIDMNSNNGILNSQYLSVSGVTGATSTSRYVGGTTSIAPTTGMFSVGDYVIAQNGGLFICTSGGTPGTWTSAGLGVYLPLSGGTMSGSINLNSNYAVTNVKDLGVFGVTGATSATRYVGGTSSVAPTSGTFSVGDYVIAQSGNIYICTTGGTPGIWTNPGSGTYLPLLGGTMSGNINMNTTHSVQNVQSLSITGVTGAMLSSRYVGGTNLNAPISGMFSTGDYVISGDGNIYICTSGGTPGTWTSPSLSAYLPLSGGVMSGTINMNGNAVSNCYNVGVYGLTGANAVHTRYVGATDTVAPTTGTDFLVGDYVIARNGGLFVCVQSSPDPIVWATPGTGTYLPLSGGTMAGSIDMGNTNAVNNAQYLSVSGLTGATQASRYIGGTASSSPSGGPFSVGDFVIAQNGGVYVCKVAGTPGIWTSISNLPLAGGTMSGNINMNGNEINTVRDLAVSGVTGANVASRYVGAVATVAPTTGTFSVGDYVIARNGNLFVCTSGGSPGTWTTSAILSGVYLPLAGGTMAGPINMGTNAISNGGTLTTTNLNATSQFQLNSSRILSAFDVTSLSVGLNSFSASVSGTGNTSIGSRTLLSLVGGTSNVAVGYAALNANTSGTGNTAVGYKALLTQTTASNNTAFGYLALTLNTGSDNVAVGYNSFTANSSGSKNVAIGYSCLTANTGSNNVAVGYASMNANTSASGNVGVGYISLLVTTTSQGHTAIGYSSLATNSSGTQNTACGFSAMQFTTIGSSNVAMGNSALRLQTQGNGNTAVGWSAQGVNTTASTNTSVGYTAGNFSGSNGGNSNVALGHAALAQATGSNNVAVGRGVMTFVGTASGCVAIGYQASPVSSGNGNTVIGYTSGNVGAGATNTCLGYRSLINGGDVSSATAIGYNCMNNNTGTKTTAIGAFTSVSGTALIISTCIGYRTMSDSSSNETTAVGYSVTNVSSSVTSFGYFGGTTSSSAYLGGRTANNMGVGIGYAASTSASGVHVTGCGANTSTGSQSVCVGYLSTSSSDSVSLGARISGSGTNTAVGYASLNAANASGTQNTGVGYKTLLTITSGTRNTALGYTADVSSATRTNSIVLGSGGSATANAQLVIHGAGSGTSTLSSGSKVVSNTTVTATSIIIVTATNKSGTGGTLYLTARSPNTSFTVTSTGGSGDNSSFNYWIFEP